MHFGEHLMIDGYKGNIELLDSKEVVLSCLHNLPEILGMKKLSEPVVYRAKSNNIKDPGGWTGVVVIAESHISVHTFPDRGFVSIDVYTCQNNINKDMIIQFFASKFQLQETEVNFVIRGKKYPESNIHP